VKGPCRFPRQARRRRLGPAFPDEVASVCRRRRGQGGDNLNTHVETGRDPDVTGWNRSRAVRFVLHGTPAGGWGLYPIDPWFSILARRILGLWEFPTMAARTLIAMLLVAALAATGRGGARPEGEPHVSARLLANTTAIVPGEPFLLGVELTMADGWHIYWKNPGEAGLPTEVTWDVPKGFQEEGLPWPVPIRFTMPGDITSFGYEGSVMLASQWLAPEDLKVGDTVTLSAKVRWLACKGRCVPGEATVRLRLPLAAGRTPANGALFGAWFDRLPHSTRPPDRRVEVAVGRSAAGKPTGAYAITVQWSGPVRDVEWFPVPGPALALSDVQVTTDAETRRTEIAFTARVLKGRKLDREMIPSVVAYTDPKGRRRGVQVNVPLERRKEPKPAAP